MLDAQSYAARMEDMLSRLSARTAPGEHLVLAEVPTICQRCLQYMPAIADNPISAVCVGNPYSKRSK